MDDPNRRPLPHQKEKSSRAMWIVGYALLAIVVLIALYAFIGTAAR
ncbi:MAG: hypothetical protein ACK40O_08720 [Allosphingosinicella sp.]